MIYKTAVVLAGGQSSRMNYNNKSFLNLNGEYFIEKILEELSDYKEIIIVSNNTNLYNYLNVPVVKDIIKDKGPLGGIHSALINASYDECLCVACDMPMITRELVNYLGTIEGKFDALIPRINGKVQPLCGIYKKTCLDKICYCLDNDIRRIVSLYSYINVRFLGNELNKFIDVNDQFKNINTPYDYNKLIQNI